MTVPTGAPGHLRRRRRQEPQRHRAGFPPARELPRHRDPIRLRVGPTAAAPSWHPSCSGSH